MNNKFRQHTTNTAFMLSMSKRQIDVLLALDTEKPFGEPGEFTDLIAYSHFITTGRKLIDKGLVEHDGPGWKLTNAGKLSAALMREAGFASEFLSQEAAA